VISPTPTREVEGRVFGGPLPDDVNVVDGLSQVTLNPVTIRGIFLLLTRLHYSDAEHFGLARQWMKNFIWSDDPKVRKLFIDYDFNYAPAANDQDKLDQRPAVFVGTDDFHFEKLVTDNLAGHTSDRSASRNVKNASTKVLIRHVSRTPDEALQLADLSCQFFMGIQTLIQNKLRVRQIQTEMIKTSRPFEHEPEQADPHFMADLIVGLDYEYSWNIVTEGHRIKTWGFEFANVQCGRVFNNAANPPA
jgi:hypothetical protein